MEQQRDRIKEQIQRRLIESLLPALEELRAAAASSTSDDGKPSGHHGLERLSSPELRAKIEQAISAELDKFFIKKPPQELYAAGPPISMTPESLQRLQLALAEASARTLVAQLEPRIDKLAKRINVVPESLKPGWLMKALQGLSEDLVKSAPNVMENEKIQKALSQFTSELSVGHGKIKPEALGELRRELGDKVLGICKEFAAEQERFFINAPQKRSDNGKATKTTAKPQAHLDDLLVAQLSEQLVSDLTHLIAERPAAATPYARISPVAMPWAEQRLAPTAQPESAVADTADTEYELSPLRPRALIFHCIDPRFQRPIRQFLQKELGLSDVDCAHIAVPGGAMALGLADHLPKFAWALKKWIGFVAEVFPLERVICIGHHDCRTYQARRFTPYKPGLQKLSERERQIHDLKGAIPVLEELAPGLPIEIYYINLSKEQKLHFEAL